MQIARPFFYFYDIVLNLPGMSNLVRVMLELSYKYRWMLLTSLRL